MTYRMDTASPFALRRQFYIGVSLLMGVLAVSGFWRTYFGPLVTGASTHPALIHVHASVFTGWLVLFLAQAVLAATGHTTWHLKLGRFGLWYGLLLIAVGLFTGVSRSAERLVAGQNAEGLLWAASSDMVFFGVFFAAAAHYRRKHELHKRLMIVAATAILIAAVGRLLVPIVEDPAVRAHVRAMVWALPILSAIAYDVKNQKGLHPAYALGLLFLVARNYSAPISRTETWSTITAWATGLVL